MAVWADWNADGPTSGATGYAQKARELLDTYFPGVLGETTWVRAPNTANFVQALIGASGVDFRQLVGVRYAPTWSFHTKSAGGVDYLGGWYLFLGAAWSTAAPQGVGAVNVAYAAHGLVVMGAPHGDDNMVIRCTGTSMADDGTRTPADFELIDTTGLGAANKFFQTAKKWLGNTVWSLDSGTGSSVNLGLVKAYDHGGTPFTFDGFDIVGRGAANDAGFDIEVIHHKADGWTYNAGAEPDPPIYASLATDYGAESDIDADHFFSFERSALALAVAGDQGEGLMLKVTTTTPAAVQFMNAHIDIR